MSEKPPCYAAEQALERAQKTLRHYFQMAWQEAGLRWDADNASEVDGIVEDIFEAAVAQAMAERRESE